MSVQLILYPQNYGGTHSSTSTPVLNEYIVDGNFNTGFANIIATGGSTPGQTVMLTYEPISAWRGWYAVSGTYGNISTAPSITGGLNLTSRAGVGLTSSGAYQLISNLTQGTCYEVTFTVSTGNNSGTIHLGNYWGTGWTAFSGVNYANLGGLQYQSFSAAAGTYTTMIITNQPEEVLVLEYRASDGTTITISNISITECPATAPLIYSDLADGQVICDLYEEETIPLSLSVDDFKNVAEKTQSYSKDFHLPNTKRNNKIFEHIFEVSRTTGLTFNPYRKTRAIVKEDSYTLFEGFLQLIEIKNKEGEISYNVNLFSEAVTLKDILGERTLGMLSWGELEHSYDDANIQNSWTGNLALNSVLPAGTFAGTVGAGTTGVLKYPLCDWTSGKHLDSNGVVQFNTLEDAFRPFIKLKYIIDKIMSDAQVEYASDFFDTADFNKMFMDFNWGNDITQTSIPETSSWLMRDIAENLFDTTGWHRLFSTGTSFVGLNVGVLGTYNVTNKQYEETVDNTVYDVEYFHNIGTNDTSAQTVQFRWTRVTAGISTHYDTQTLTVPASTGTGGYIQPTGTFQTTMANGSILYPEVKPNVADKVFETSTGFEFWAMIATSTGSFSIGNLIQKLRGEISQWDFMKGIFTMFNLIVLKEDEKLRIEPYGDIFVKPNHTLNIGATAVSPVQHDWTAKVDISDINLKPLELKRLTTFAYEEDEDDYAFGVYKAAVSGYLYGSKKFLEPLYTLLAGEEEVTASPFASTVIKPIFNSYDNDFVIPSMYTANDDGTEFEGFENAPRIMYDIQTVTLGTGKYSAPFTNPQFINKTTFRQFGHLSEIPTTLTTKDLNFGSHQLFPPLSPVVDNLYTMYYAPYYNELYHPDTRVMTLKVNLTPSDIQNFKFWDTVLIKNQQYRVNTITYKPKSLAKVEFILIP